MDRRPDGASVKGFRFTVQLRKPKSYKQFKYFFAAPNLVPQQYLFQFPLLNLFLSICRNNIQHITNPFPLHLTLNPFETIQVNSNHCLHFCIHIIMTGDVTSRARGVNTDNQYSYNVTLIVTYLGGLGVVAIVVGVQFVGTSHRGAQIRL